MSLRAITIHRAGNRPSLFMGGDRELVMFAGLLAFALIFGLINALVRPVIEILTCPLIILTLGLFTLVINALMLLVTGWLSESWNLGFTVMGFWAAFWGGLVVGLVSMVLSLLVPARATRPYVPTGQPPSVR